MSPPDRRVRIGVAGTGAVSQLVHLPLLSERDDVVIGAVSDADAPKARAIGQRFAVDRVLDDDALLSDPDLEAILVCTPNHLHEQQAVAALEAGKHVLVERPLALTAAGCRRVLDAARAAGRTVMAGMSHRFRQDVLALRAFVSGGELGRPYAVRVAWMNRKVPLRRTTWRQRPEEAGGGALMDLGVQALDLGLWLLDNPRVRRVSAVLARDEFEVEDAATLLAEADEGIALSVEVSWSSFAAEDRHYARVLGTDGSGSLPPLEVFKQLGGRPIEVTPRQPRPQGGENPYTNAYRRLLDDFVQSVAGRSDAELPREQVALMSLIEASYRAAGAGREVELQ
jgi:predicted dehydrogenase